MSTLVLLATLALTNAQRGATPSGHALLLGTQRTGTTWAMAELDRSPCVSTTSELFIQFKWERGARMACLRMLYGDLDPRDRSLRSKCSAKFRGFLDKSRAFALKNNATGLPSVEAFKWMCRPRACLSSRHRRDGGAPWTVATASFAQAIGREGLGLAQGALEEA